MFGLPDALAPEVHPHVLQHGAKLTEALEIPENRLQVESCEGGVRIVSLDDGLRPHLAVDRDTTWNILQGPICIPSHIGGKPVVQIGAIALSELPEITKVIIPAGVRLVNQRAFYGCPKLKSVTIYQNSPDSIQVMGNAFPPGCIVTYAHRPASIQTAVSGAVNEIV
jgi:hypothetical protein